MQIYIIHSHHEHTNKCICQHRMLKLCRIPDIVTIYIQHPMLSLEHVARNLHTNTMQISMDVKQPMKCRCCMVLSEGSDIMV